MDVRAVGLSWHNYVAMFSTFDGDCPFLVVPSTSLQWRLWWVEGGLNFFSPFSVYGLCWLSFPCHYTVIDLLLFGIITVHRLMLLNILQSAETSFIHSIDQRDEEFSRTRSALASLFSSQLLCPLGICTCDKLQETCTALGLQAQTSEREFIPQ